MGIGVVVRGGKANFTVTGCAVVKGGKANF